METRKDDAASTQDIIALASGIASEGTARRLWAESLTDQALRSRVAWSLPPEDEEEQIADAVADAPDGVPEHLQRRVTALTDRFVRVKPDSFSTRILDVLETLLHLPCLSPAIAASDSALTAGILTQSVISGEGARIEFQQLPLVSRGDGASPTVRVLVDASAVTEWGAGSTATVVLSDGENRQDTLTIPLNAQARGYRDTDELTPTRSARRLVAVSLSMP